MFGLIIFINQFPSLNFRHSSLITHHFKILHPFGTWHHHSIFFTLFMSPIPVTRCSLFFFFFLVPRNPNQKGKKTKKKPRSPKPGGKKQKRRMKNTQDQTQEKKQKKSKNTQDRTQKEIGRHLRPNPGKKKKKVDWSKGALSYDQQVPHMCLITKMPLNYELQKLKTTKMCFQFP